MFLAYASRSRLTAYQAGSPSPDLSTPASAASPAGTQAIIRMTYGSSIVKELIHYYYSSGGDSGDAKGKEKEKAAAPPMVSRRSSSIFDIDFSELRTKSASDIWRGVLESRTAAANGGKGDIRGLPF